MDYSTYLQSDDWQQKRSRKFRESRRRCAICQSTQFLEVHHLVYRNWFDVQMSDLRILCSRCHEVAHSLTREGLILAGENTRRFLTLRRAVRLAIEGKDWQHLAPRAIQKATQRHKWQLNDMESRTLPTRDELDLLIGK